MKYTPVEELKEGDEVILVGDCWGVVEGVRSKVGIGYGDHAVIQVTGKFYNIMNIKWQVLKVENKVKPVEEKNFIFTTFISTPDNPRAYGSPMENEEINKAIAKANSWVKRNLRMWPYLKVLAHELDRSKKEIKFYWKDE